MPFTNKGRVITSLLKNGRKRGRRGIKRRPVCENLVTVGVLAGENRSPTRRTQRSRDKRIFKYDTFARQAVEMWCFEKRMPGKRKRIVALIVNQDKNDVGTVPGALSKGIGCKNAECSDQKQPIASVRQRPRQSGNHIPHPNQMDEVLIIRYQSVSKSSA